MKGVLLAVKTDTSSLLGVTNRCANVNELSGGPQQLEQPSQLEMDGVFFYGKSIIQYQVVFE